MLDSALWDGDIRMRIIDIVPLAVALSCTPWLGTNSPGKRVGERLSSNDLPSIGTGRSRDLKAGI